MTKFTVEIFIQGQEPARRTVEAHTWGRRDGGILFWDANTREIAFIACGQYMTVLVKQESR